MVGDCLGFYYSFRGDPEREAETQAEGEAGSLQGARLIPGSRPEPEEGPQPLSHPGVPNLHML